ncbi:MAG TPA: carboxy terminal-processing peptidase, partial [Cyclobacteriaceae bacterium]|nr:carboxy terminal-processing peptidase [Cyclobacteriaceae bacterium]
YFNQDELNIFLANSEKLGSALAKGDCSIIKELAPIYKNALTRADRLIRAINQTPMEFDNKDTLRLRMTSSVYLTTDDQLKKQWTRIVKLGMLTDNGLGKADATAKNDKASLDRVCNKYLNVIKRRLTVQEGIEEFLQDKLMNAIATSYDPHTEFFSKRVKQLFLDALSSDHFSFGVMLEDDPYGNIVISRIVPGSSAWDYSNLHVGDIITAVSSSHMEKIDANLYSSEEIDEILTTISSEVELSVKKPNGEKITVKLKKQKLRDDENKIKSLVLSNDKNKFGYINLPVFFSKSELSKTGCATDLAKEIIQLKKAKIQGLILDLRNNGGGDLEEAIELAGIFIDKGAICITKTQKQETITLKDNVLGTAYDGPLVVMINKGSASASEIFAAAMRAHNRAILVGGTTYGKGTGQSVMAFPGNQEIVKITSFRFYDVKGRSNQGRGVDPDIALPDLYSLYNYGESAERNVLKIDAVDKKTYYTPLEPMPIDLLRDSSNRRVSKNVFFNNLEQQKKAMSTYIKGDEIILPLTKTGLANIELQRGKDDNDTPKPVASHYTIKLTSFDQQVNGVDTFGASTFKTLIDKVSDDYYIDEALNILRNYTQLNK